MSLLLDALKRAAEEKRAKHAGDETPAVPELGRDDVEAYLAGERDAGATGWTEEQPPVGATERLSETTARVEPEGSPAQAEWVLAAPRGGAAPSGRRRALIVLAAVLAVAVGGLYLYALVADLGEPATAYAPRREPPPARPAPEPAAQAAAEPAVPAQAPLDLFAEAPPEAAAETDAPAPAARQSAASPPAAPERAAAAPAARRDVAPRLHIARGEAGPGLAEWLQRGYRAYQAGDWAAAEAAYRAALARSPDERHALLGLAAVLRQTGRHEAARALYQRRLAVDPHDALAAAGLAALDAADPALGVAELKRRLSERPDSPELWAALGLQYARQRRWPEARRAYAEAWRRAPDSADHAYNLAVALDRLGRREEAILFYRRALEAGPGAFDPALLRARLAVLEAARGPDRAR